jgi:DNA-binding FadR family transcriptional regulator
LPSGTGTPLFQSTVAFLRDKIASGEWPVNSRIPTEPQLQELLGVGKTTVREAVRSLANLGMLEALPARGTFVRSRSPVSSVIADFVGDFPPQEILGARRALEVEAARLAAQNRTDQQVAALRAAYDRDLAAGEDQPRTVERGTTPGPFHHLVFEAAGSDLLARLYAGVLAALRRRQQRGEVLPAETHAERIADHGAVLDAIVRRHAADAANAMARHAGRSLGLGPTAGQ